MADVLIHGGAGAAVNSDDLTAVAAHVLAGDTFMGADTNDEAGVGTMEVQSVVSFKTAVSGANVTFTWQNPSKGPYGGVIIRAKEGSYPTSVTDGTQVYKGTGTSYQLEAMSSATWAATKDNTTWYFSLWMYCETSLGTIYSQLAQATAVIFDLQGTQVFTSSGVFTVPAGVYEIDVFLVGAGAGGNGPFTWSGYQEMGCYRNGPGGGSGYTVTYKKIKVTPEQQFNVTIGAGGRAGSNGTAGGNGGQTKFGTYTANGGYIGHFSTSKSYTNREKYGGNGGSAGGAGSEYVYVSTGGGSSRTNPSCDGASNGANAKYYTTAPAYSPSQGLGQGKSTRAFEESNQALYAGGGGGAAGAAGGAGGGGKGGTVSSNGVSGTANTGSGGGGGYEYRYTTAGAGGSGIVIARWGY